MSRRITFESIAEEVLLKMRAEVGALIEKYVFENLEDTSAKLRNLRRRYDETGGSGHLLLPDCLLGLSFTRKADTAISRLSRKYREPEIILSFMIAAQKR